MTRARRAGLFALILCALGSCAPARLASLPPSATVVWAHGDRVYLASPDSTALAPGTWLSFEYDGRSVATGEVTAVSNRELIAARLTSGSLRKIKKLERIRVAAMPRPFRAEPVWRIGYPSRGRSNLLFACDSMTLGSGGALGFYRVEERTDRTYRLARDPGRTTDAPWPDTLVIRLFHDDADEEIALERGELDAAVFWPGEASTHIREVMRWRGETTGMRARGLLAAIEVGGDASGVRAGASPSTRGPLEALSDGLFRGDLIPCALPGASSPPAPQLPTRARFEVDPACPGRPVLEQFLHREDRSSAAPSGSGVIRVFYLDAPVQDLDSLCLSAAEYVRRGAFPPSLRACADRLAARIRRGGAAAEPPAADLLRSYLGDSLRITCLYRIGCPVVSKPDLRPYLNALGTDALVNLLDCPRAGREP